jgi:hypothetical protein
MAMIHRMMVVARAGCRVLCFLLLVLGFMRRAAILGDERPERG